MSQLLEGTFLDDLGAQLVEHSARVASESDLKEFEKVWTSKEGHIKRLFGELKVVPAEAKAEVASRLNFLKETAERFVREKREDLQSAEEHKKLTEEYLDVSLPGLAPGLGMVHPVSAFEQQVMDILRPLGFQSVYGPEIETEYYCFDSLNIPPHHPARDMQDTFYTSTKHVLRTHTTSIQARYLQKGGAPLKVATFGRTYRNEKEDASHQSMFHQFELIWVEQGLTLGNLMGLIEYILKKIYGKRRKVRFVPKFYPYTEPSVGPQIDCSVCSGKGCPACGGAGWVTIGGSGMIHRKVFQEFGYNPDQVSGIAFGLGTSRLVGQFYNFPNLKAVYDNDVRVFRPVPGAVAPGAGSVTGGGKK